MFKFWRTQEPNGTETVHYEGSFDSDKWSEKIGQRLATVVETKLADAWIEQYGAELLKEITPDVMQKAIETEVAKRIIK